MAHTIGITGLVAVPGTDSGATSQTGLDLYYLLGESTGGIKPYSVSGQITIDEHDVTAFASSLSTMSYVSGISSWTATVQGRYPNSTAATGRCGQVTFANGYDDRVNAWTLALAAQAHETTEFASTCPTWRSFMPGLVSWNGSFAGGIDDTNALVFGASGSATLRMSDEAGTDNTLAGSIFYTGVGPTINVGQVNQVSQTFRGSGALTTAGDTPLFAAGAIGIPDDTEFVISADGSRTYTGRGFWTGINVSVAIGATIDVSVTIQGNGALTPA